MDDPWSTNVAAWGVMSNGIGQGKLRVHCGPDDSVEPVVTIMKPDEDYLPDYFRAL